MPETLKVEDMVLGAMTDRDVFEQHYEEYRAMLPPEIPEEQARSVMEATWEIMWNFAAFGWGQHPVQQAMAAQEHEALKREENKTPKRKSSTRRRSARRTR